MVWRGPMVTTALQQLLHDTAWDNLDYLIIDLPPGTGDIQLTLAQKIPVTGAVIVTTPQDIALLDVQKAVRMFEKVRVPIIGVVENMSVHVCEACGHEAHIFGQGGGARLAAEYGIEFLGALALSQAIRERADEGNPIVVSEPEGPIAQQYLAIADKIRAQLIVLEAKRSKFPRIVVE